MCLAWEFLRLMNLLSPVQSLEYAGKLYEQGIPCELHIYENGNHGLSLADQTSVVKEENRDVHIATWTHLAVQWLRQQFENI